MVSPNKLIFSGAVMTTLLRLFFYLMESHGCTRKGPEEGMQREWPEDMTMNQSIKDLVSRRWKEYGI